MTDKRCNACATRIPEEATQCPRCDAAREDAEIDLGSPVTAIDENISGPPSGASFLSWDALLEARLQTSARGEAGAADDGHEIDLGAPVAAGTEGSKPPSGASLLSWDALLKTRQASLAAAEGSSHVPALPSGPTLITSEGATSTEEELEPDADAETEAETETPTGRSGLHWAAVAGLGVVIGVVVLFVMYLAG
jgi:hypothetical protein